MGLNFPVVHGGIAYNRDVVFSFIHAFILSERRHQWVGLRKDTGEEEASFACNETVT